MSDFRSQISDVGNKIRNLKSDVRNPTSGLGYFRFRSPLLTEFLLVFFPPGTEMFYFPGSTAPTWSRSRPDLHRDRFPHSDISGSKVARHLPEAYRRQAASFIAFWSQGIHHTPLFPIRKLGNHLLILTFYLPHLRQPKRPLGNHFCETESDLALVLIAAMEFNWQTAIGR